MPPAKGSFSLRQHGIFLFLEVIFARAGENNLRPVRNPWSA
jgi:hypothetical protein